MFILYLCFNLFTNKRDGEFFIEFVFTGCGSKKISIEMVVSFLDPWNNEA